MGSAIAQLRGRQAADRRQTERRYRAQRSGRLLELSWKGEVGGRIETFQQSRRLVQADSKAAIEKNRMYSMKCLDRVEAPSRSARKGPIGIDAGRMARAGTLVRKWRRRW
jgi:hypothetical protein